MMSLPISVYKRNARQRPYSLGYSKYCLNFNRVNTTAVDLGNPLQLEITDNITIGVFVNLHTVAVTQCFFCKHGCYQLRLVGGGAFQFYVYDGIGAAWELVAQSTTVPQADRFYHVIGSYEQGVGGKIYVNGVLEDFRIGYVGAIYTGWWNCYAGRYALWGPTDYVDGLEDEIYVYHRILSDGGVAVGNRAGGEIAYNLLNYHTLIRNGLALQLRFEHGTGLIAYDGSDFGTNGTLIPAITPPTWTRISKYTLLAESEV